MYVIVSGLTICDSFNLKILDYGYNKEEVLLYASIREAHQLFFW